MEGTHSSTDTAPIVPNWVQPSHPNLIEVSRGTKPFSSGAISLVSLPAGSHFTNITSATPVDQKAYTTVQTARGHVELNSDLVFCNHSCAPSLEFDMKAFEVRVARDRPLTAGDELTFFYPSTEWDMAQPFTCSCGAPDGRCKGWIAGASRLGKEKLQGYWLNEHIVSRLVKESNL